MNDPTRPDGRQRALYAAAAAGLDIAAFVLRAVWLICIIGLAGMVVTIVGSAYHALF